MLLIDISPGDMLSDTGLGSAVVRASAYGTGGPGFDCWGRVIPNTLKMAVMASLLGAQELTDPSVSV